MQIKFNQPAPVKTPPTTYDLIGLTQDEVATIRLALGRTSPMERRHAGIKDNFAGTYMYNMLMGAGF